MIPYQAQIRTELAARRDALIELTRAMIQIPTINPPCDCYLDICELLAGWFDEMGFTVEMLRATGTPGDSAAYPRWNILAKRSGTGPGPCVHFNGHTDVVEVGAGWTTDPFGGEIRDGRIYGRGSCDMKGGLASAIIAADAFIAACPDFRGTIEISGTADEETGGFGGVAWLAEQGRFAHVDHVIIPEPLGKDRICLGHRGVYWAEIETEGRQAHGSMPFLGDCAVRHMGAVLREFEDNLYPALATKRTDMPVIPEGARQSTLNINSIHGGEAEMPVGFTGLPAPNVPDRCRMVIDRRFLIEESLEEVKAEIRKAVDAAGAHRDCFHAHIRDLHEVRPSQTGRDAPIVQATTAAIQAVYGRDPRYVISPGTYDQKHIDRIGRLKNCIAYGPGVLELAHQPDEWIGIDDMMESAEVMALVLADLLAP